MKKLFLLCFCVLFSHFSLKATHVLGGHMRGESLDSGKYLITTTIYRDCRGTALSTPNFGVYAGNSGSNACGSYSLSGLTRVSIREVTNLCSTSNSQCSPANTYATGEGVEEHIYKCTVDLNKSPFTNFTGSSCCEMTFYINIPTSISPYNSNSIAFNMVLMMNRCNLKKVPKHNGKNNSPLYSNLPKNFLCCQQPNYEAQGAIDTIDFDSLSYRLEALRQTLPNIGISYPSPFTKRYFMTPYCKPFGSITCSPNPEATPPVGLYFSAGTGDIVFTPVACTESGWRVIETDEYRQDSSGKWLHIGMSMSIVNYTVLDGCGINNSPVVSGTFINSVCAGDKICFNISGKDATFTPYQTTPDTVQMSWDGAIPGAVFTLTNPGSREKTVEFCWQTKPEHQREHAWRFSVTATDQHCSPPSKSSRTFSIFVRKKIVTDTPVIAVLPCRQIRLHSKADSVPNQKVKWVLTDTTGKKLAESAKAQDTVDLKYTGKVYVQQIISNMNCIAYGYDSVVLMPKPSISLGNDTAVCRYANLTVKPVLKNAQFPVSYTWSLAHNPGFQSTDSSLQLKIFSDSSIFLTALDNTGCAAHDTLNIKKLGHSNPIVSSTVPGLCFRDPNFDLSPYFNMPGILSQSDTVYSDSAGLIIENNGWQIHPTALHTQTTKSGAYTSIRAFVKYTDTNTCTYKDSFWVNVAGNPKFQLSDTSFCQTNTHFALSRIVQHSGATGMIWNWALLSAPIAVKDSFLLDTIAGRNGEFALLKIGSYGNKDYEGNYIVSLQLSDTATGCKTTDTAVINLHTIPIANFTLSPDSVAFLPSAIFTSYNTSQPDSSQLKEWTWYTVGADADSTHVWTPIIQYSKTGLYKISLEVVDSFGCRNTASLSVRVDEKNNSIHPSYLQASQFKINSILQILEPTVHDAVLYLYDASGRLVFTGNNNTGIQNYQGIAGMYFYKIQYTQGTVQHQAEGRVLIQ